jgi:hypothetical protein
MYGEYSAGLEWFEGVAVGLFFAYVLGLAPSLWYQTPPSAARAHRSLRPSGRPRRPAATGRATVRVRRRQAHSVTLFGRPLP